MSLIFLVARGTSSNSCPFSPLASLSRPRVLFKKKRKPTQKSRQRTLDAFYNASSAEEQVALLSDDFALHEDGSPNSFGKEQYEETMKAAYASVPDWNWTHATDALVDAEG